jgi:alkaline phosphatase D
MRACYVGLSLLVGLLGLAVSPIAALGAEVPGAFHSDWPADAERTWLGPEYWPSRLQDWRIAGGRLECVSGGQNRNVALLTRQLGPQSGGFETSVRLGRLSEDAGWAGFRVGSQGNLHQWPDLADWRDDAIRGRGLEAGLTTEGNLFIGRPKTPAPQPGRAPLPTDDVVLRLSAEPQGEVGYALTLAAVDPRTGKVLERIVRRGVPAEQLVGGVALVCDAAPKPAAGAARPARKPAPGDCRFWFRDWTVSGDKLAGSDAQAFGPILWTQYTLSGGVLKMTAQMPPIGLKDTQTVRLEINTGGQWKQVAEAAIDPLARTATFRVAGWDSTRDTPYRAVYAMRQPDGTTKDCTWAGTVRHDPEEKDVIEVAGFTGNADPAWPNVDLVATLRKVDPDVLFFSGDNIYEPVAGYGTERSPLERACLDYLRKWYFFGWAYRDLLRDRPTVSIPDDHDVYQGNLWGAGGVPTDAINKGGYAMPAAWVKMVERTQTSNLPDPYDPTPIAQGIGVYYCPMTYGRISFAVIEDRKFKTGPEGTVPPTGARSDWVVDPNFDPKTADVPGAKLLGDRQLQFLDQWAADWSGADMKMVLSQTVFAGAATNHGGDLMYLVADYDSGGWPQTARNKALDAMRRGFAFHLCGDQHLATLIHHGIDAWDDACWSMAAPSIANYYMRAWWPKKPGIPLAEGMPKYTGRYFDGLGNRISVWAATNPEGALGHEPAWLHDRKPGFALVKLNKKTDQITVECWPRWADPTDPDAKQYEGWPKTISKLDNYGRQAVAYLPTIKVTGMANPVVQVIDRADGRIVYTVRIVGNTFRPKVFREGTYTLKVGEQPDRVKTIDDLHSLPADQEQTLEVAF